jgi:PAS domain S-box-containing protein
MADDNGGDRPSATVLRFPRLAPEPRPGVLGVKREITFEPTQFWAILDMLPVAVFIGHGSDCAHVEGNTTAHMLLRSPPGQNLSRTAPEDEKPDFEVYAAGQPVPPSELPMQRAAATGKPVPRSELEARFANGDSVFLAGHSVPLVDEKGAVCGSLGTFIDITAIKQLERLNQQLARELAAREARLRMAFDAAGIFAWDWDLETGRVEWSEGGEAALRLSPGGFGGTVEAFRALVHPDDMPRVEAALTRARTGADDEYEVEFRMRRGDGTWRRTATRGFVQRDRSGSPVRVFGVDHDVSAKAALAEQAKAALEASEKRLAAAIRAGRFAVYDFDLQDRKLSWNDTAREIWGYPPSIEITYEAFLEGVHPDDRARVHAAAEAARDPRGSGHFDEEYRVVDQQTGAVRWVRDTADVLFEGGRPISMRGIAQDITAAKQPEVVWRDSEARLRLATEAGQIGVFDWDLRSGELRWDNRLRELWALPPDMPVTIETFYAGLHPDDVPRLEAIIAAALDLSADGSVDAEYRVIGITDGKERDIVAKGRVSFEHGRAVRMIGTVVEVTEQRQAQAVLARDKAELERLVEARTQDLQETQARLAHAQRLEALGRLAGGIAHDFNNVLQAVQGGSELIERHAGEPDRVRLIARALAEAADRGAATTHRLLAFSRRGDLRTEEMDPAALLAGMQEILRHTLGAAIEVRVEAPVGLPMLLADKAQLETVLVNLATNARDAMPEGGVLTLAAALDLVEPGRGPRPPIELAPGRYARLTVTDTGLGMTPEVLARVAEPFFTTKQEGKGTGLGLAMAKGFAEQSGGGLAIESVPGQGTRVTLWLPVAERPVAGAAPSVSHGGSVAHGLRRVLLVDDDDAVREVIIAQLEAAGYAVMPAASGAEALTLLDLDQAIDAVISDLSMPGIDGLAVIREARSRQPGLPAILLTGFVTAEAAFDEVLSGPYSLLRKPVTGQQLAERVGLLLENQVER